jgi:ubiquinone/menaquinone biosynthesis C-methylase UbiE
MAQTRKIGWKQAVSWLLAALFAAGLFYGPVGVFTGPILGLWLVGTQRPLNGFLWLLSTSLVMYLPGAIWRGAFAHSLTLSGFAHELAMMLLGFLPLIFHRLVGRRLPRALATLPFPLVMTATTVFWFDCKDFSSLESFAAGTPVVKQLAGWAGLSMLVFLLAWTQAMIAWLWREEFRWQRVRGGVFLFVSALLALLAITAAWVYSGREIPAPLPDGYFFAENFTMAAGVLAVWALASALVHALGRKRTPLALTLLRAPGSGETLQTEGSGTLISTSGARFRLRHGVPDFRTPADLTGANGHYNRLYQLIGGFYDDIQRVVAPMQGFNRGIYVHSYLDFLEVKPGDRVLETSVGTALNFHYLPANIERWGLDLSDGMLEVARVNLDRWGLPSTLVLGNAERLPFADESFDVVFHVGGINFFSDRAAAIREMIRVAQPGSRLLIADETEEHVRQTYERGVFTSSFYRNRQEAVATPIDLLPPEMEEVHLETLNVIGKNRFYVLTFRKPAAGKMKPC